MTPTPPTASLQLINQPNHSDFRHCVPGPVGCPQLTIPNASQASLHPVQLSGGTKEEKSDEQKKNDLINEKLFKLTNFQGTKGQSGPNRQKSIDKGGDFAKIRGKKSKEKQQVHAVSQFKEESSDNSSRESTENPQRIHCCS